MKRPTLTIPTDIEVPCAVRHEAANGTPVYVVNCPEYEVVRVTFVFHAGTVTQRHPFTASATANMLAEGTASFTAQEIAERLDYYGSYFDINIDRDYAYVTFCALSKFFGHTAEIIEEVVLRPAFPEGEVATYRAKRRQQLAIERRKVETIARENFARAVFGAEHPYGISYDEAEYDSLDHARLAEHYRRTYTARNCMVVCSGRIDEATLRRIIDIAAALPSSGSAVAEPIAPFCTTHDVRVRHAGAVQSSIRMGRLLFPRTHEDFIPMQVLATVLGGYFGSRLMQNLRERSGFTYGVYAAMVNFQQAGYLAIATQVGREVTQEALRQIAAEIETLRTEPVTEEELALVKNIMAGEMMRILDGPFGIADVTTENLLCGFGNAQTGRSLERIRRTTPDELLALAQKYLRAEDMVTVVAGDWE